jgi:hypothetical protein
LLKSTHQAVEEICATPLSARGSELPGVLIHKAAAIEPVHRKLAGGIRHEQPLRIARVSGDVALRGDADISSGECELRGICRILLRISEDRIRGDGIRDEIRKIKRSAQRRVGDFRSGGVDAGELVQQLNIASRGNADVSAAGADDLIAIADDRGGLRAGTRRSSARGPRAFSEQKRTGIRGERGERLHARNVGRCEVGSGREVVGPRLRIGGEQGIGVEKRGIVCARIEAVAQCVEENGIARGA